MKNLVKALFVFAVSAFVLTSCNKEKAAVNKLEGEWHQESVTASETGETCDSVTAGPTSDVHWTFAAYTVGDEETGTATEEITVSGTTTTNTYSYSVNEDGDMLTLTPNGSTENLMFAIDKLSKSSMELSISLDSVPVVTACSNGYPSTIDYKTVSYSSTWEKE